jgi:ABC-type uncharacterized transport system involved in gliding motility auxiliary subunit
MGNRMSLLTPPPLSALRRERRAQSINQWIFLPILIFLLAGVNYISWRHYRRADFSLNQFQKLSGQTLNLLKSLPGEVTLTAFLAPEADTTGSLIQEDVQKLLDEYKYRSSGKVKVELVQPYLDFQAAQKLAEKFKLTSNENVILVQYGDRSRVLKVAEMAEIDPGAMMTGGAARVKSFQAEEKISSAISGLVQGKPAKVYVTSGSGEYNLNSTDRDPAGYSLLSARLASQNVELLPLKLGEQEGVPADADAVMVAGPKFQFSAPAVAALQAYLVKPGRLLLLLDPGAPTGLEGILAEQGVVVDADKIFRKVAVLSTAGLTQGLNEETVGTRFSGHPAIQWIESVGGSLRFGPSRSITIKPVVAASPVKSEMLVETSDRYWAKPWPLAAGKKSDFVDGEDRKGPFAVAAVVDGSVPGDKGKESAALRAVVVGSASAFANQNISPLEVDFMVNSIQWVLGRSESLGISPKTPKDFSVSLDDGQQRVIMLGTLLGIPAMTGILGLLVWWRRRS